MKHDGRYFQKLVSLLTREQKKYKETALESLAEERRDPFRVLVSCLISLRTKDAVTLAASQRLFALADTPETLLRLSVKTIEKAIYPAGFYKTKARRIKEICQYLLDHHDGEVPDTIDALLKMKGVGRKTANIVVTFGFDQLGMAVDTHVHRISNRLGLVSTKTPDDTEMALRALVPQKYWLQFNNLFVSHGQNTCAPISPHCSRCEVFSLCQRKNVEKHR